MPALGRSPQALGARRGAGEIRGGAGLDGVPSSLPCCFLTEGCSSQTDENASSLSGLHIHSLLKRNVVLILEIRQDDLCSYG